MSQAVMDQLGRAVARMLGRRLECLTYYARSSASAVPVAYTVHGQLRAYRAERLMTEVIAPEDRELWLQTVLVTWTPSRYDALVRADGTRWQVLSIASGPGTPAYLMQCRQVG